jgi:prevent-host-death family protein
VRERVSVSQLKARLSLYMERVKGGRTLVVTDRGVPVAEIAPLTGEAAADARMQALIRSGQVRSAEGKLPEDFFARARLVKDPEGALLRALLRERGQDDEGGG